MINRRTFVGGGTFALIGAAPLAGAAHALEKPFLPKGLPEGIYDTATLEALPGKRPLIKLTYRPPNYETPLSHFTSEFTTNESFFVRYHLAGIPARSRRRCHASAEPKDRGRRLQRTTLSRSLPAIAAAATGRPLLNDQPTN
jgi:hypothetical protein